MSLLMDYGSDWPPRERRRLLRWLNEGKRRRRPGFDRFFRVNATVIVGVGVICALALRLTDRPSPPLVVGNRSSPTYVVHHPLAVEPIRAACTRSPGRTWAGTSFTVALPRQANRGGAATTTVLPERSPDPRRINPRRTGAT